jgi:hypothetical protein
MKNTVRRGIAAVLLSGAAIVAIAVPANAATATPNTTTSQAGGGVIVVGDPNTGNLNDVWTFAPLGVPVLGLVQAALEAPGRLGI